MAEIIGYVITFFVGLSVAAFAFLYGVLPMREKEIADRTREEERKRETDKRLENIRREADKDRARDPVDVANDIIRSRR